MSTNDDELADRVQLLRCHGERRRYDHVMVGTTARLDSIQAAVLRVKLRRLDEANRARRRIATRLDDELADLFVTPPPPPNGQDHVYHQYVVRHASRDALRRHLRRRGISTALHYPVPIHLTPAYAREDQGRLGACERLAETSCSLPMFPSMSDAELTRVIEACRSFPHEHGGTHGD